MIATRLYEYMHEQLRMTPKEFTRYKYHEIDWASRLVGIVGPPDFVTQNLLIL